MHALADKKKGEQQKIVSVEEPSTSGNSSFVARKNSDFKKQSAAVIAARNMKTV
jgi:uridine kinase